MLGASHHPYARGVYDMREPNRVSPVPVRPVAALLLVILTETACASQRVLVPPRLNLAPYGQIGLVTFTAENARGSLHEFATRRFSEYVLAAQTGIEVLELGPPDSVLRRTRAPELGPAAAQALGGERGVPVVFFGHLKVSNVKATVSAELSVELLSTKSGGTLWRSSATASEKVGGLSLVGGEPIFSAKDPNNAYGQLVNRLVYAVTYDLRSTWVKQ